MSDTINRYVKDPGSAITHFIGMLMAIFAAVPLIIKAAHEPGRIYLVSIVIYAASLILLYAASTTYHTFNRSEQVNTILKKIDHMMISILIAGSYTPICLLVLGGRRGLFPSDGRVELCRRRHPDQSILGILPKMGFLCTVYRYGMDLCPGFYTDSKFHVSSGVPLAACRRRHLYGRRRHICTQAPDLQSKAQKLRKPRDLPSVCHGWQRVPFCCHVCVRSLIPVSFSHGTSSMYAFLTHK